jgi:hypothetical protein
MADNPSNPNPGPAPAGDKKRQAPGEINRKYLDEIELIRALVPEAQKPDRTAALGEGEWTSARITALSTLADDLETAALAAVGRTAARKMDTAEEKTARKDLLAAISPIRTGAKRKYRNSDQADAGRDAFFVNESTSVSLDRLLFIAGSMHAKLAPPEGGADPEYALPGVTPAKIDKLEEMRGKYGDANALQSDTENIRRQSHVDVQTLYTKAKAERIDLQMAADQGWTFHNPENAAIRRAFKIPADQSLAG